MHLFQVDDISAIFDVAHGPSQSTLSAVLHIGRSRGVAIGCKQWWQSRWGDLPEKDATSLAPLWRTAILCRPRGDPGLTFLWVLQPPQWHRDSMDEGSSIHRRPFMAVYCHEAHCPAHHHSPVGLGLRLLSRMTSGIRAQLYNCSLSSSASVKFSMHYITVHRSIDTLIAIKPFHASVRTLGYQLDGHKVRSLHPSTLYIRAQNHTYSFDFILTIISVLFNCMNPFFLKLVVAYTNL